MPELLPQRVEAIAQADAQRVALVDGDERLSYGELWSRSARLAQHLRCAGLVPGGRVALILPNSAAAAVAVYGTWLAGGIVVPLNAQARARDFEPWLAHCEPQALIYDSRNADARRARTQLGTSVLGVAAGRSPSLCPDPPWDDVTCGNDANASETARAGLAAAQEAMILYTSGSTGRPKGVTLTHRNLAANTAAIIGYLGLSSTDSIVSVLPFYYSYGASVLHTHLAVGARIVLEHNMVFPHAVVETMVRERVSGFAGVASTHSLLLARVDLPRYDLSSLRYVTQAGSAMPPALLRRLMAALPSVRIYVMYGQTEATARLAYLEPEDLGRKLGSVGKAIDGVEIEIRDEQGRCVPWGVAGEVWARGDNVMQGYWRDPEATAATLIGGWLRTGDIGYIDREGYLFLAGRRSDMIKTGAHRVHPQDVEEAIMEIAGVLDAAVVGVHDEVLGQAVKAFVVLAPGLHIDAMRIRGHCRKRLAAYKVPKEVEFVASVPRTASGKPQRYALRVNERVREQA